MNWKFYIFLCHLLLLASSVLCDLSFLKPPSADANHLHHNHQLPGEHIVNGHQAKPLPPPSVTPSLDKVVEQKVDSVPDGSVVENTVPSPKAAKVHDDLNQASEVVDKSSSTIKPLEFVENVHPVSVGEPTVKGQEKPLSPPAVPSVPPSSNTVVEQVVPVPSSPDDTEPIVPSPKAQEGHDYYDQNQTSEEVESTSASSTEPLEVVEKVHSVDKYEDGNEEPNTSVPTSEENLPSDESFDYDHTNYTNILNIQPALEIIEKADPTKEEETEELTASTAPEIQEIHDHTHQNIELPVEKIDPINLNVEESTSPIPPLNIPHSHEIHDHNQPLSPPAVPPVSPALSPSSNTVVEQVVQVPIGSDDTEPIVPSPKAQEGHDYYDQNQTIEEVESTSASSTEPLEVVEKVHSFDKYEDGNEEPNTSVPTSEENLPSDESFDYDHTNYTNIQPSLESIEKADPHKEEEKEELSASTAPKTIEKGDPPKEEETEELTASTAPKTIEKGDPPKEEEKEELSASTAPKTIEKADPTKEEETEELTASTAPEIQEIHDYTHQNIELPVEKIDPINLNVEESTSPIPPPEINMPHSHSHEIHDHNHTIEGEKSSFFFVIKYLSTSLLEFLPEHLQDTILDVDDALVFTGIIALTLVSICVPYYFIEGFMAVRPLKKKVTELNKTLWKVNAAYENQQEEFDHFKKKAFAYDDDQKRIEQLELELHILKKLETKQKDQLKTLKNELRNSAKVASEIEGLVEATMTERNKAYEEREKLKNALVSIQESYKYSSENLESLKKTFANLSMDFELEKHSGETFKFKSLTLEKEIEELKTKLLTEVDLRRKAETEFELLTDDKNLLNDKFEDLKKILGQYEETVSNISQELTAKENELEALKETLGEDSPLIDIAEQKARLANAEEEVVSLKSRVESLTIEKNSLSKDSNEMKANLDSLKDEKEKAENRLKVLEAWFKEKEDELRTMVEKYEVEKTIRGKDKDDLINMIENQMDEIKELKHTIDKLKDEFEDQRIVHKNEIRSLEVKGHENWLSLCQAERKSQDARKEAEFLRQKLLALTKEKEGEGSEANLNLNGEFPYGISTPLIPPEMIPPPMSEEEVPSYFGLGDDFMPPPPLPLGVSERDQMRPAPLGRMSPNYSDLDDPLLSPIRRDDRNDYTPDYSSHSGSGSEGGDLDNSRNNWLNDQRERRHSHNNNNNSNNRIRRNNGPKRSSPIPNGVNL